MKQLFTLLICSLVGGLSAQSADWNPDADGDGLVGSSDLLALLTAYGESFAPPIEDDGWVECTLQDYTIVSDTILPSDLATLCVEDFYTQGWQWEVDTWWMNDTNSMTFVDFLDDLYLSGYPFPSEEHAPGSIRHVVSWPNTCNSIHTLDVQRELYDTLVGIHANEKIILTPPDYSEGDKLRFLKARANEPLGFLECFGADIVHTRYSWNLCCCDSDNETLTNVLQTTSNGYLEMRYNVDAILGANYHIVDNTWQACEPAAFYIGSEAVLKNGVWLAKRYND